MTGKPCPLCGEDLQATGYQYYGPDVPKGREILGTWDCHKCKKRLHYRIGIEPLPEPPPPPKDELLASFHKMVQPHHRVMGWALGIPRSPQFKPQVYHLMVQTSNGNTTYAYCNWGFNVGELLTETPKGGLPKCLLCERRAFKTAREKEPCQTTPKPKRRKRPTTPCSRPR